MAKLKNNLRELLIKKYGTWDDVPSQDRLSELIDVSQTTVSRWLSNKIDRFDSDTIQRFCRFLDCDVPDLIYMDWEQELPPKKRSKK